MESSSHLATSLSKMRQCIKATLEIKWSHFDDCSVKGINNDPKPPLCLLRNTSSTFPLAKKALFSSTPWLGLGPSCHTGHPGPQVSVLLSNPTSVFLCFEQLGVLMYCRGQLGATLTPHVVAELQRFLCRKRFFCVWHCPRGRLSPPSSCLQEGNSPLCNKKEIPKQGARETARQLSSFRIAIIWGGVRD